MIQQKSKRNLLFSELVFGIFVPIFYFWLDPVIFTGDSNTVFPITLFESQIFWYCLIGINIVNLIGYLILGEKIGYLAGFLTGIFATGAVCTFLILMVLLVAFAPINFPNMLFNFNMFSDLFFIIFASILIVVFTIYIPFYTCFIYSRHCYKLFQAARKTLKPAILTITILLGLLFAIGVPLAVQWRNSQVVTQAIQDIAYGDDKAAAAGTEKLRTAFWCASFCQKKLWNAWQSTNEPHRKMLISQAYKEFNGQSVEDKLREYDD